MKMPLRFSPSLLALAVLLATPAGALGSTYLEIPPIDGEQATPGHPDVILVDSYSLGANVFTIVKQTDSTSDDLVLAVSNGTNFPTASLLFYNSDPPAGPPDSSLDFQGVFVTSFQSLGASEQVTFNFQSVVPEPATLSLLALAAPLILRRRRAA